MTPVINHLQTYNRLQKLNITMSYSSVLSLVDKVGADHDVKVHEWRDVLVHKLSDTPVAEVSD